MSTKTTFKRIALVAVASLGFGLLSVVPSNAAIGVTMNIFNGTAGTVTTSTNVAVGAVASVPLSVVFTAGTIADAATVTCVTTTRPANFGGVTTTAANPTTFTYVAGTNSVAPTGGANVATIVGTAAVATANTVTANYTPNVPGIYVVTCTLADAAAAGTAIAGGTLVHTWTINAGFSADSARANKAFAAQGTNITTGWTAAAGGQATVRITGLAVNTQYFVTTDTGAIISGIGSDPGTRTGTVTNTNGANLSGGFNFTTGTSNASDTMDVRVTDLAAASTTVTVRSFNATTGLATTFVAATVTWGAAPAASAQFSSSIIAAGAAVAAATDALGVTLARTTGVLAGNITVSLRDQNNNPLAGGISATVSGPGLLSVSVNTTQTGAAGTGRAVALAALDAAGNADGTANVSVYSDGTGGVATITITSGTVTIGVETVTFFGSVATLEATQNLKVARASATGAELGTSVGTGLAAVATTAALTPAVVIVAKDSNGIVVPGLTITGLSSDTAVISSATVLQAVGTVDTTGAAGPGTYLASVTSAVGGTSGATATVTFRTASPTTAGAFISAPALTFTLGGVIATENITFDKATYEPGEAMVVTRTAKDSAGNPVFDGNATPAITFNKALGGSPILASFYVGGVRATSATTPSVFAPVASGVFTARATSGNLASTALTATATVADDAATTAGSAAADAASEATDAANAATDAANAAAEAADAATAAAQDAADAVAALSTSVTAMVADLRKQITALTNLVIKIQKKVKA